MKASLFLAATGAILATAGPINKRAITTDWVVEVVTVTVTAGDEPTVNAAVFMESAAPTTTVAPVAAPAPTTLKPKPKPIVKTTKIVAAPAPVETSSSKPAPVAITSVIVEQPKPTTSTAAAATTAASGTTISSEITDDYKTTVLNQHNLHRANHSVSALEWDDTLAQYAEITGNKCLGMVHDMTEGDGGYGQNLASISSDADLSDKKIKYAASGITNQWYNDEMDLWSFYGLPNPGETPRDVLHFSQMVWKNTKKVGCATVLCPSGDENTLLTVCNYSPPGNYGGEYGANVLEPLHQKMVVV